MRADEIRIENARAHNLKGVSCRIPVGRMTVVSGVSGSGKSSLAFDTLYAEGQRRYVASLSTYARQFLERLPRPDVDAISNLPPAIAIEQRNRVTNARSTVGTATEILDHLRLLFARVGETRCCGSLVRPGTVEGVTERLLERYAGGRLTLAAPLPRRRGETPRALRDRLVRDGYTRLLRPDGSVADVTELSLQELRALASGAELVMDRLAVAPDARARIAEAVAAAFAREGELLTLTPEGERRRFREGFACDECGRRHPTPEPALFSFNSPLGACEACHGFGRTQALDLERVVPDEGRSLAGGAIAPFQTPSGRGCQRDLMRAARAAKLPTGVPWRDLSEMQRGFVMDGDGGDWYGVRGYFEYLESRRYKVQARVTIARYRRFDPCESCGGTRLRPEALSVYVGDRHIGELARLGVGELDAWLAGLRLAPAQEARGARLLAGLRARVGTAREVGLGYLSLERQVRTLSGGEAQRIQLATALGGALTGTLYVLDEPSIGLHARDVARLLRVLHAIRDQGNTVVVVEHAPEIVAAADHVIDLGPGAGRAGGRVVAEGSVAELAASPASLTGRMLAGGFRVERKRRGRARGELRVRGASAHNLKDVDVAVPLGQLVVVSGVSGAGKSSLVRSVLVGHLRRDPERGPCLAVEGGDQIDEVVVVEPTPPARSLRSNPATVSKAFDGIRRALAATPEARRQRLTPGWFSFNVPGGRCESCEGTGETIVDMQFLEDVRVPCDACGGRRYRKEADAIRLHGRSVSELLALTIDEAQDVFAAEASVLERLAPFARVGLGYLTLAQPLSTLSGGELQRMRVAMALGAKPGRALYVLDEPTTGLHAAEVQVLLDCLEQLLAAGGSVVVVEHNLDVIRLADHVIDLGPEGGPGGGRIVAQGPPEAIAAVPASHTGRALRALAGGRAVPAAG
jgi:excinuclease ABC subunit A